ncbi:MAG: YbaN family protein [Filifactoraceae bacterium]
MRFKTVVKLSIGFVALLFAAMGVFLPVWPTTPFVMLAIGCFSSTPKIQSKILKIKFFKEYYESYTNGKGINKLTVKFSLAFLWIMLGFSAIMVNKPFLYVVLLTIGIVVSLHILWIAKSKEERKFVLRRVSNEE